MPTLVPTEAAAPVAGPPPAPPAPAPSSRLLFWLALLGAVDACYLLYLHVFLGGFCGSDACPAVLNSPYARVLGVPLAAPGVGLFLALAWAARRRPAWLWPLALLGNLVTPYLIYGQVRVGEWCPYCLLSSALLVVLLLAARGRRGPLAWSWRVPALFVLPVLATLGRESALARRDAHRAPGARTFPFASIDGRHYGLDEIDASPELTRLQWERYRARLAWVDEQVLAKEAEVQGTTVEALRRDNIDLKVVLPPGAVEEAYRAGGGTEDPIPRDVRMAVAGRLALRKRRAVEEAYLAELRHRHMVEVSLPPPDAREEVAFNPRGGPVRGPDGAPLRIVLFSDFGCGACARVHEWLAELPAELGVDVQVAFRHYPLVHREDAKQAAAAGVAAHRQGKFWQLADVVFARGWNPARLDEDAQAAGLDLDRFHADLAAPETLRAVEEDLAEGRRLGVKGTPALFLNGVYCAGVPDVSTVRAVLGK